MYQDKQERVTLRLVPAYKEDNVAPWKSKEFHTYKEFSDQVMGFGKLAFTRSLWPEISSYFPSPDLYYHTGVILPCQDGTSDLVEVKKCGNVVKLNKKEAVEMIAEQKKTRMFFDNTCLAHNEALDTKRTLFRVAKIINKSINYTVNRLNCDHVATWILTGRVAWTTAVVQVSQCIPFPNIPGEVDEEVLAQIEELLQ